MHLCLSGFQFSVNKQALGYHPQAEMPGRPCPSPHWHPSPSGGILRRGLRRNAFSPPSPACSQEGI